MEAALFRLSGDKNKKATLSRGRYNGSQRSLMICLVLPKIMSSTSCLMKFSNIFVFTLLSFIYFSLYYKRGKGKFQSSALMALPKKLATFSCKLLYLHLLYGDNVTEKHGINRDRTGDREKTRYLCGKQGIFTRDRALIRPGSIRQLETRASTRSASFFHALGGPGRPYNGGGAAGAYRTHNGAKPLKQGHLRAKRGPLGPSRKSQQQTKRTGFAAHGHSIAETAPEGKRASRANGALNRAKINGRGQKQGFGGVDRRRGGVTSCYSRRYDDGGDRAITGGKCGKAILHFPHSRVEL